MIQILTNVSCGWASANTDAGTRGGRSIAPAMKAIRYRQMVAPVQVIQNFQFSNIKFWILFLSSNFFSTELNVS